MGVVVRSLEPHEWRTYRAVRLAALQDSPHAYCGSYAQSAEYPEQLWRDWCTATSWFAFLDEDPVGMVRINPEAKEGVPEMLSMWVAPRARGTSVSTELVDAAVVWTWSSGGSGLHLHVMEDNVRARRFYARLNFVPTARHALPDGRYLLEMTRNLA